MFDLRILSESWASPLFRFEGDMFFGGADTGEGGGDGCEVIELKIMSDHVHLFVSAKPISAPNQIVFRIKGYTSRKIREEFEHIRKTLPSLWTRSYFVSTAGNVSSDIIQR